MKDFAASAGVTGTTGAVCGVGGVFSGTASGGTVKDETWYRVLVGPFTNRDQLTVAQKQLAGSGFNNLLLQQRR